MFLIDLLNKDVKFENETKKVMVAFRVIYLVMFIALIIDVILGGVSLIKEFVGALGIIAAANILLFIGTYRMKTKTALWLFIVFSFLWVLVLIPMFGWSAGIQNFLFPMLLMVFFGSYDKSGNKFVVVAIALAIRIGFILEMGGMKAGEYITPAIDKSLQIVNITSVFSLVVYIAYTFSKAEKEAEGKLVKYNDKLKAAANTDQLTGLFNRRRATDYLKETIEQNDGSPVSVSIGDIDFFKKVNDNYGHDIGDEVLKSVASTMKDTLRSDSFIARWGGEEFLIILRNCNGDQAYMALERLRRRIQDTAITAGGHEINITMTFGVSEYDFSGDMNSTIKTADERLYHGKENGRNQVVF
ncbi:MAG: GGDEF domain-containing protein [Lachnospiraceae bacterium]|nr:GGDEF domain-containing protein [Lachnospiraceae bacterium]